MRKLTSVNFFEPGDIRHPLQVFVTDAPDAPNATVAAAAQATGNSSRHASDRIVLSSRLKRRQAAMMIFRIAADVFHSPGRLSGGLVYAAVPSEVEVSGVPFRLEMRRHEHRWYGVDAPARVVWVLDAPMRKVIERAACASQCLLHNAV